MSGKRFVDTNILMYAHDQGSGPKHRLAKLLVEEIWNSGTGVLSTQVLQEFCINLRRKALQPLSIDGTRSLIQDYLAWEIVVNNGDSILQALDLEARYKISFWDALIIQAAETAGADILYSEDLADGQFYGSVRVVNPLSASASAGARP